MKEPSALGIILGFIALGALILLLDLGLRHGRALLSELLLWLQVAVEFLERLWREITA